VKSTTFRPSHSTISLIPECFRQTLLFVSVRLKVGLILVYNGEQANTPADDHWWLSLNYKFSNSSEITRNLNISFLPTGDIDLQRTSPQDLDLANTLLAPTITLIRAQTSFDFWKMINWLTISIHWTFLYNLGQTAPTIYPPLAGTSPILPNFSNPTFYSDTNNIFVNDTLFEIYSTYLRETILPILNLSAPAFLPLNETNRLYPQETTFVRSYNCQKRVLKSGWIFSVFSVDFAFASGAYTLVLIVAGFFERRRQKQRGMNCISLFDGLIVANHCEGCVALMNGSQEFELDRLLGARAHLSRNATI
jgi:hypothetical protein